MKDERKLGGKNHEKNNGCFWAVIAYITCATVLYFVSRLL